MLCSGLNACIMNTFTVRSFISVWIIIYCDRRIHDMTFRLWSKTAMTRIVHKAQRNNMFPLYICIYIPKCEIKLAAQKAPLHIRIRLSFSQFGRVIWGVVRFVYNFSWDIPRIQLHCRVVFDAVRMFLFSLFVFRNVCSIQGSVYCSRRWKTNYKIDYDIA